MSSLFTKLRSINCVVFADDLVLIIFNDIHNSDQYSQVRGQAIDLRYTIF